MFHSKSPKKEYVKTENLGKSFLFLEIKSSTKNKGIKERKRKIGNPKVGHEIKSKRPESREVNNRINLVLYFFIAVLFRLLIIDYKVHLNIKFFHWD